MRGICTYLREVLEGTCTRARVAIWRGCPASRRLYPFTDPVMILQVRFRGQFPTLTQVNRGSTFALRRSTLDFCLGGQRS